MNPIECFIMAYCILNANAQTTSIEAAANYQTWLTNQAVLPHSYLFLPFHRAFRYNDAAYWRTANNSIVRNGTDCWRDLFVPEIGTPVYGPSVNNGWTISMWVRLGVNSDQNMLSFYHLTSLGEARPRIIFRAASNIILMRGTQSTIVETKVACVISNSRWEFVAMAFDKQVSRCYMFCNGVSNWTDCSESSMILSQGLLISRGASGSDSVISCLQMYDKALNSSEITLAKDQCRLFDTLFDGVGDGSCHINPTSDGWICDECYANTTSPICLGLQTTTSSTTTSTTTAEVTTTTAVQTSTETTPVTTQEYVEAPDINCSPTCDPRSSVCTTMGVCRCLGRFLGQMCDKIVGIPLSDPISSLSHHSYLNDDGIFEDKWHIVGNESNLQLIIQSNNAIRLTSGSFQENGCYMVSKLQFPFIDFTINATFEIDYANAQDGEGLKLAVVSNQSINWNSSITWGIDTEKFSGLAVTFSPANGSIDLYMSRVFTTYGSSGGSSNSAVGFQSALKGRFHVGLVVRRGYRIWLELCTMLNCEKVFSAFDVIGNGLPMETSLEPPVLFISAYGLTIDVIDFRAYSLTPPERCKCKPLKHWCYGQNKCLCKPGWTGSTCHNQICGNTTCSAIAYCKDYSKSLCVCFDKTRTGANCDEPFCDCAKEGRCSLPAQKCQCQDGSRKSDCNAP